MKDIKSLYLKAKQSGRQDDINRYSECIEHLLERDRYDYISNIEYIISSNIGLPSLKRLVEGGISLADYDIIMEHLEKCVKKCRHQGQSDAEYKEAIAMMEFFNKAHSHAFMMYEAFEETLQPLYVQFYYERKTPLVNSFDKLYSRFGDVVIPDMVVECTRDTTGENMKKFLKILERHSLDPKSYEWVMTTFKDVVFEPHPNFKPLQESVSRIQGRSLQGIVDNARKRNIQVISESVLSGNDEEVMISLEEKEVLALRDLISFKEYMITCLEDTNRMMELQNEVYDLYQELGEFIQEDGIDLMEEETRPRMMNCSCEKEDWVVRNHKTQCKRCGRLVLSHRSKLIGEEADPVIQSEMGVAGSVVPMLPPATQKGPSLLKQVNEFSHMANTRNKHDGSTPGYLSKHHDLGYGEDDGKTQRDIDRPEDDEGDATLDDFRRPELADDTLTPDETTPEDLGTGFSEPDPPTPGDTTPIPTASGNIQNYYYHTYVNSFNRQKDDHSQHTNIKNVNSTMRTTDDHSIGKRIHSDNIGGDSVPPADPDPGDTSTPEEPIISKTPDPEVRQSLNRDLGLVNPEDIVPKTEGPLGMFNSANMEGSETRVENGPWVLTPFDSAEVFEEGLRDFGEGMVDPADDSADIGSADDRPKSDRPVRDTLTDIDRKLTKTQQGAKKRAQAIHQTGRIFMKPFRRTNEWINNMIQNWKDKDENAMKEKMADPHARKNLFTGIKKAVAVGSLFKAGILLNPIFLFLAGTKKATRRSKEFRIRNEMIGELKAEIEVIEEKIKDADRAMDTKAKYRLMRLKNEINKKLIRVGGTKKMAKMI